MLIERRHSRESGNPDLSPGSFYRGVGRAARLRHRGALPRRLPAAASRDGLAQRYGWTPAFTGVTYAPVCCGETAVWSPYADARLLGELRAFVLPSALGTSSFPRKRESRSTGPQFLPGGGPGCSSRCRGALPRRWPATASRDGLAQRSGWTPAFAGVTYALVSRRD